jgi:hypothetical protein
MLEGKQEKRTEKSKLRRECMRQRNYKRGKGEGREKKTFVPVLY